MRRSLSVAAGLLGVLLVIGTAIAQTSQPDRPTRSGWWWAAQTNDRSTPVTDVAADEIAVERQGNAETRQAAVWFDVSDVTEPPERVILRLRQVSDTRQNGGGGILACAITRAWTEADGGPWSLRPTPDCSNGIGASKAGSDGYWSFDVTSLVWEWASGARVNHGIALYSSQSNLNPSYLIVLADLRGEDVGGLRDGTATTTTTAPTTTTTTVPPTTTTTTAPELPAVPPAPDVPAAPSTPEGPSAPDVPAEVPSDLGALPSAPGVPDVPGAPEGPGLPDAPGGPDVPGAPADVPSDPGASVAPWLQWLVSLVGDPAVPPAPGTGEVPADPPSVPPAPGAPGSPSTPGVDPGSPLAAPAVPSAPALPKGPDAPSDPEVPDPSGTPNDPEDPAPAADPDGSGPQGPGAWLSTSLGGNLTSGGITDGALTTDGFGLSADDPSLARTGSSSDHGDIALGVMANDGSRAPGSHHAPWLPLGVGAIGSALCLALAVGYQKRRLAAG